MQDSRQEVYGVVATVTKNFAVLNCLIGDGEGRSTINEEVEKVEGTNLSDFQIYPNPFGSSVVLSRPSGYSGNPTFVIFNSMGELIQSKTIMSTNSTTTIDLEWLMAGVYFLHFQDENGVYLQKIVKQKN